MKKASVASMDDDAATLRLFHPAGSQAIALGRPGSLTDEKGVRGIDG